MTLHAFAGALRGRMVPAAARRVLKVLAFMPMLFAAHSPARADGQLAADKGCLSCHSNRTPKKNVATFAQLAERYAPLKTQPAALHDRAEKLRTGAIADHVNAHERLSAEDSARLVQWLADGAP